MNLGLLERFVSALDTCSKHRGRLCFEALPSLVNHSDRPPPSQDAHPRSGGGDGLMVLVERCAVWCATPEMPGACVLENVSCYDRCVLTHLQQRHDGCVG